MTVLSIPLFAFFVVLTTLVMAVGMIFLVIAEALVPSGSLLGPSGPTWTSCSGWRARCSSLD